MMEDFEKDIKKHFQQRQIQPSENAWGKMEQLLNADKPVQRKPRTIYYILSAAATVLLFVGLWSIFQQSDQVQFHESKPAERMVVNEPEDVEPVKEEEEISALTQDKELIVTKKIPTKVHLKNKVYKEIIQNKNQPKENEVSDLIESHHIVQISEKENEEKHLAQQSKIEIKVNPNKLLRSAEMERQTDNMVSNGQNFWKKVKEINTVVAHSK